ncbi:MAG: redoxin domain-containing protein, partial [Flavobacteriales bacterium]|nr:redoxin domain-containing protein [Flavobacteriales bacterium]
MATKKPAKKTTKKAVKRQAKKVVKKAAKKAPKKAVKKPAKKLAKKAVKKAAKKVGLKKVIKKILPKKSKFVPHSTKLKEGSKAPDFSGLDQNGKTIKLADYKGKSVVLYFYPKDNTPGCTLQA